MSFFDRKYKLTVGKRGSDGIVITDLQFVFTAVKSNSKEPNVLTGDIYNLSEESRKHFVKDNLVTLEVAYGNDDFGTIFIGNLVNVNTNFQAPDIVTHFDAGDAIVAFRDGKSSRSFPPGVTVDSIVRACVADMGISVGSFDNGTLGSAGLNRKYQKGYSIVGTTKNALDTVISSNGLIYMIQEGTITIVPVGQPSQEGILLIDPTTGLIGSPELITIDLANQAGAEKQKKPKAEKATDNTIKKSTVELKKPNGVKYKTLMNPELRLSRRVKVESRFINHVVTNQKVTHSGDYRGGEWSTECEGVM